MRAFVFAIAAAGALISSSGGALSEDSRSSFARFVDGKDLVDHLMSPQGPHLYSTWQFDQRKYPGGRQEVPLSWRKLASAKISAGIPFYYLAEQNPFTSTSQIAPQTSPIVFTTASVHKEDGSSQLITPTNGGCVEGKRKESKWKYGGWEAYESMVNEFNKLGKVAISANDWTWFCTSESDIRAEVEKQLKSFPRSYSFSALKLILDQIDKELQTTDANLKVALEKIQLLAPRLAENSTFTDALLNNEAFVSALRQKLQQR